LVTNGGFENDQAWIFGPTAARGQYTSARVHSEARSVRLGIEPPAQDIFSWSSVRQPISIPADAGSVRLSFWFWPASEGASYDLHEALILTNETPARTLKIIFQGLYNHQAWIPVSNYDLTEYRGQTIVLYFNAYNDLDTGYRTWMYVDDVSMQACP